MDATKTLHQNKAKADEDYELICGYLASLLGEVELFTEGGIRDEKDIVGGCYAAINGLTLQDAERLVEEWGFRKGEPWDERIYITHYDLISMGEACGRKTHEYPIKTPLDVLSAEVLGVSRRQAREWIVQKGIRFLVVDHKWLMLCKGRGANRESAQVRFYVGD